jgi:hypothetical protein
VISKLGGKKTSQKKNPKERSTHIQALDEKSHPIQWTEFPTGALVGAGSCWPPLRN